MSRDRFLFFANFKEMAKKMPADMRLKFYDSITDYVFEDKESDDEMMNILITAIKPSLDKDDGRGGKRENAGAPENNQNAKKQSKQKDKENDTIKNNQKQSNNQNNQSFLETETVAVAESNIKSKDLIVNSSAFDLQKINVVLGKFGLPTIKNLTDERKQKLKERIRSVGSFEEFLGQMEAALAESSFLQGDNSKGWRADFDFFLQKSSWQKVIEGKYADRVDDGYVEGMYSIGGNWGPPIED